MRHLFFYGSREANSVKTSFLVIKSIGIFFVLSLLVFSPVAVLIAHAIPPDCTQLTGQAQADCMMNVYGGTGTGGGAGNSGLAGFLTQLNSLINYVVPFLVGIGVLIIIYGILGYISSAGEEEKRKTAREFVLWGIIGVFIMLSVWGLINILVGTFNLNNTAAQNPFQYTVTSGSAGTTSGIGAIVVKLEDIMAVVTPFIVGLAVLIIIYGIVSYIAYAADEEKRKEARAFVIWGVVGVFLMLSIWGFVNLLVNTFNLNNTANITASYPSLAMTGNDCTYATVPTDIPCLISRVNYIGSTYIIPLFFAIAVFIVLIGLINYIRQGDNEEKRKEARAFVIWGVISIFLMLSIWGLVNILVATFGLSGVQPGGGSLNIPTVPCLGGKTFDPQTQQCK